MINHRKLYLFLGDSPWHYVFQPREDDDAQGKIRHDAVVFRVQMKFPVAEPRAIFPLGTHQSTTTLKHEIFR